MIKKMRRFAGKVKRKLGFGKKQAAKKNAKKAADNSDAKKATEKKAEPEVIVTDAKTIFFYAYDGRQYACSPKAIYESILKDPRFDDYNFIWAFREPEKFEFLKENKNTTIVKMRTAPYRKAMEKAKYWVINTKLDDKVMVKPDQIFLQCWHGTPLKRLGLEMTRSVNALHDIEFIKNRYILEGEKFDYFISPSAYSTERFVKSWALEDKKNKYGDDIIIELGYPRNDFLFNYTKADEDSIKERLGIEKDHRKVILYAPTIRTDQHTKGVGYTYEITADFDKLRDALSDEFIILFRPHYMIAEKFEFEKYKDFVVNVTDVDDVNELYIISDILVTDYSSVFFDYANLKRPMIFFMYDLEHYRDESNGFSLDVEEVLPGRIIKTNEELIETILYEAENFVYDDKYKSFNETYNYLDDGKATERVIEKVFF